MQPAVQPFGHRAGHGLKATDGNADINEKDPSFIAADTFAIAIKAAVLEPGDAVEPREAGLG
jgi:hypothetical protein